VTFATAPAPIVVDASVAVELVVDGGAELATAWAEWIDGGRLIVAPSLLWVEVANVLLRGRGLPASAVSLRLEGLEAAGLETTDRGARGARAATDLAARHALTVYDAAYLWLAIDVDGELATRDRRLIEAAQSEGVALAIG